MADDIVISEGSSNVDDFGIDVLPQGFNDDSNFSPGFDVDLLRDSWVPESDLLHAAFHFSGSSSPVSLMNVQSSDSTFSLANYIENFLMEDVDWGDDENEAGEDGVTDFLSSVLFHDSERSRHCVDNPESCDTSTMDNQSIEMRYSEVADVEDDKSSRKKRRMQMSNRDSAIMAREKKKMRSKDPEMMSEPLEIYSRRFDFALRSCSAENMVLNKTLKFQMNGPFSTSMAKQESAVLFVESLLLGSLLWLVSLVRLFIVPSPPCLIQSLEILSWPGRYLEHRLIVGKDLKHLLLRLRRRYRCMRSRVKFFVFPVHAFYT